MSSVPASQVAHVIFKSKWVSIILNLKMHCRTWPSSSHRVLIIIALTNLPRSEDQFYSSAIKLTDEAILSLKKAVEENQLKDDQFYFLSYLLSRPALSLKELVKLSKVKSIPLIPRTWRWSASPCSQTGFPRPPRPFSSTSIASLLGLRFNSGCMMRLLNRWS